MIKKCVIPIAGMGTRFLPITKTISKEMLPIVDVPTIYLQVREAYLSGIKEIIFVVLKRNKPLIQNFFSKDSELTNFIKNDPTKLSLLNDLNEIIDNVKFTYVLQQELGTFGALYSARNYLYNEFFGVMYGDDLVDSHIPLLKQLMIENERTSDMVMAVHKTDEQDLPYYGIVKYGDENIIQEIVSINELPHPSEDVIHGRFIVHTSIFDNIDKLRLHKNNERHLPEAMLITGKVRAYQYEGNYYDIGNKLGYMKANIAFSLKRKEFKQELISFIQKQ